MSVFLDQTLEIVIFSTNNSAISNYINFLNFLTTFLPFIAKLFSIISCKVCLHGWTFRYFIMKHVALQFFLLTHRIIQFKSYILTLY